VATKANAAIRVFVALGGYQVRAAGSGCVIESWRSDEPGSGEYPNFTL
jgi:hypothetical protein